MARETKHVSFRMPAPLYRRYADYAEAHGIDLSALLNLVLSEIRLDDLLRLPQPCRTDEPVEE